MTIATEDNKSAFKQIYVTRSGLSDKKPEKEERFTQREAEIMANGIMDFLGI